MQKISSKVFTLLAATTLSMAAHAAEVLVNGGFETGSFSNWTTTTNGAAGCNTDWNVGSVGTATGCSSVSNPYAGTYAAYNSFDGPGPLEYRLKQSFTVPGNIASATLSWVQTYSLSFSGAPRSFEVLITDAADTSVLATVSSQPFTGSESADWTPFTQNIAAALAPLAGQTVNVVFRNVIPENFTGPAGFGLDDVSLDIVATPTSIPTLSEWGMILLSTLLALATIVTLRRKHQ